MSFIPFIQSLLPTGSPGGGGGGALLDNCNIICDGNSLTYGAYSSDPATKSYPAVLRTLAPFNSNGASISNRGVNGQTTIQMEDDAITDIDNFYNPSVFNILVCFEIGNDIYFNPGTASLYHNRWANYCYNRKAKGWHIVTLTNAFRDNGVPNTPAGDNQTVYNQKRLDTNNLVRTEWTAYADRLFDLGLDSNFSSYNTTYFTVVDQIHFSDIGYAYIAQKIRDILLTFT